MTCIRYAAGYKYQLRAPYNTIIPEFADSERQPIATEWIALQPDGNMTIMVNYCWDGASGPTYDSRSSMRGSLVHDAGYQLLRLGLLPASMRGAVDNAFHRICVEDGMLKPRAWLWFHAVRIFASPAADPAAISPDECAPDPQCCHDELSPR